MITDIFLAGMVLFSAVYYILCGMKTHFSEITVEFWLVSAAVFSYFYIYRKALRDFLWADIIAWILGVLVFLFILLFIAVFFERFFKNDKVIPEYAVIFGANEKILGKKVYNKRIEKAGKYLLKNTDIPIIISGYNETGKAAKYLIEKGIHPDRIITDEKSETTLQNVVNSVKMMKNRNNLVVFTSGFHVLRCKILIKMIFPEKNVSFSPAGGSGIFEIHYMVREVICFGYDFLSKRIKFAQKIKKQY